MTVTLSVPGAISRERAADAVGDDGDMSGDVLLRCHCLVLARFRSRAERASVNSVLRPVGLSLAAAVINKETFS